jgi:hypothetical protein
MNRHAIRIAPIPSASKQGTPLTVSLWYSATSLDTAPGTDLFTGGDNFVVRMRAIGMAAVVRHDAGSSNAYVLCQSNTPPAVDGTWHHVAAVFAANQVRLYYDGGMVCSASVSSTVVFDKGSDLFAGRHGNGEDNWDHEGHLDDVRVYTRALANEEIAALALGR